MTTHDEAGSARVVFEAGAEGRAAELLAELGAQRVLVVATARHRAGADRVAQSLGDACVGVWAEAAPQVPRAVADSLLRRVAETDADWVLAHGGGTAIGACKVAGVEAGVRVAAIPTTYSGSEMTSIWAVSSGGSKTTARDAAARPSLVIYDPDLVALRPEVAHVSLFNALAHAVDALFDAEADHEQAERAVRLLVAGLDGDPEAALRGAHLAGRALDGAQMALQHKLAHVLGGSFGAPHAQAHAVLLPHTLAFNATGESLRRLKRAFDAADPAAALWDRGKALGVPLRLGALGIQRSMVPQAVDAALSAQYPNPRALDAPGLTRLLLDAVHGRRPSRRTTRAPIDVPGPHGGLEATRRGPPWSRARGVLIAVHGRGSSADAFVERVRAEVPHDVVILAPQADGCTWYPSGFKNLEANKDHLSSAMAALDATFALATEHVPAQRVAVVGFSQGACLALSWLSHRGADAKPAALAAWTGAAIPSFDTYPDLSGVRTYLGSAERDPWVPLDDVRRTESALVASGATHTTTLAPSDEHTIRPPDFAALRRHLEILMTGDDLTYQYGFGSALMSEARPHVVPRKQNAPQTLPGGLYSEQINGTGFTVRRGHNHRVWLYRLRPQIGAGGWERLPPGRFTGRFEQGVGSPELLRFAPTPYPAAPVDWLDGVSTFAGAGDPAARAGFAIHVYSATADMERAFSSIDGDLLVVPQEGALRVQTELGWLHVTPGQILILPRAIKFRVTLPDGKARGFVGELFNGHYQLPERGPVGANGLADERHFAAPVAAFEDVPGPYEVVLKQGGDLWRSELPASPFDVVGWHGTYAPFKYDLLDFNAYWGANFDHPDPSILTVLTAPHDDHGRNAVDFAVFRGRWDTIEHSFRPPFLHRNSAVEFNAVLLSKATSGPYQAGASTWTPYLSPHGVSVRTYEGAAKASPEANDRPHRIPDDEMWMQFESTYPLRVMPWFLDAEHRDGEYYDQFQGYRPGEAE